LAIQGVLFYNVLGPFFVGTITEVALKFIVGINLIGRRLLRLQAQVQSQELRGLTSDEVWAEVRNFKYSKERNLLGRAISPWKMTQINYKEDNRDEKVLEIAWEAIKETLGFADVSFFQKERLKMVEGLSLQDTH
jgi:hypothetical protein